MGWAGQSGNWPLATLELLLTVPTSRQTALLASTSNRWQTSCPSFLTVPLGALGVPLGADDRVVRTPSPNVEGFVPFGLPYLLESRPPSS